MAEHERIDEVNASRVVAKTRSVCVLAAWAIESLIIDVNPPETKKRRFEVYEGVVYALELAVGALGEALETMNGEKPLC